MTRAYAAFCCVIFLTSCKALDSIVSDPEAVEVSQEVAGGLGTATGLPGAPVAFSAGLGVLYVAYRKWRGLPLNPMKKKASS